MDAVVQLGGCLSVLHAVPLSFGEHSIGMTEALHRGEQLLSDVRVELKQAGVTVAVHTELVRAWPHEIVG